MPQIQRVLPLNRTETPAPELVVRERASRRIRRARSILCELLMCDSLGDGSLLVGCVNEALDAAQLELEQLAGQQELYELWIG